VSGTAAAESMQSIQLQSPSLEKMKRMLKRFSCNTHFCCSLNDSRVPPVSSALLVGSSAFVLFFNRRQ
jgi:hypothetical protein